MQAIITKVLPATNNKPTRIKATCERGSLTLSLSLEMFPLKSEEQHIFVVNKLCYKFALEDQKQYGSPIDNNPWLRSKSCGQIPSGDYVHVFNQ